MTTPIVSPTTTERKLRTLGLTAMFCVFSGWFLYDGYVGYPRANLKKLVESLNPVPETLPPINERITEDGFRKWSEKTGDIAASRLTRLDMKNLLGEPGWESPDRSEIAFFGRGGVVRIQLTGDLVKTVSFTAAEHRDVDLLWQKILGFMLAPVAIGMLFQIGRVLTTRVELSDLGLKVRGRPVIPFESMTGIVANQYTKKGFLDVTYDDRGTHRKVRLDDYVVREFRPIVEEICRRCSFTNPLPPPRAA